MEVSILKKIAPVIIIALLAILLFNRFYERGIEGINIYQMISFSEVKEDSLIEITNAEVINSIVKAFDSAIKQPGIVNMREPDYKVEIASDTYFLWISQGSGTIMNTKDTHTIYSLSEDAVLRINGVLAERKSISIQSYDILI